MINANINALRDRVKIQKKIKTVTAHGIVKYTYVDYKSIWASVIGYSAKFLYGQTENINEIYYRIVARKTNEIHIDDILLYKGKKLKVTCEPVEVNSNRQYIFIEATELVES